MLFSYHFDLLAQLLFHFVAIGGKNFLIFFNSLRLSDAYICVSRLTIIGSDNGFLPVLCQGIIWTSVGILLIEPLGANFRI